MATRMDKKIREEYLSRVEHLMYLISKSSVHKEDTSFKEEDVVLPKVKWIVRGYQDADASYRATLDYPLEVTVESDLHTVCSLEADDAEKPWLYLSQTDYKKFVKACKQRKLELSAQRKNSRAR